MSSTQQAVPKPSLSGVRIKARKGQAKAAAKHEPSIFRDQLYKHLEVVPPEDFDAVANKLIQAGSTLEYQKYADAFFEIILVGGLLQPGGAYVEDGAPMSPFSILRAKEPVETDDMKKYCDVLNKVIRRYKYMQKPLEEVSLPALLQYSNRWPEAHREKFSTLLGLLMAQGLASAASVQVLSKDHLVKDNLALSILSLAFRAYLKDQSMEHLASALKKGGIKDIMDFFPLNKRTITNLDAYFRENGLPAVAEWYSKRRIAQVREIILRGLREHLEGEDDQDTIIAFIKEQQEETPIPEPDLVTCLWAGLIATVDLGLRPDQADSLVVQGVTKFAPILEPFCTTGKTQVALLNAVQVYCYDETRVQKSFPLILKTLYNKDCLSSQAIFYWHQKGAKPQGKQHFLKVTQGLVNKLQEQEDESDED